jgi:ribulose-phosphate 3-epimerase
MIRGLAPSILSFDLTRVVPTVQSLAAEGVPIVHLDVMDGQFVPPITFGDAYARALSHAVPGPLYEAHLMTLSPERHFESFRDAGCGRIIFHAEVALHAHRHVQALRQLGVSPGIALNPATPAECVLPILGEVDLVLVMTVNPGWGGQAFLPFVLDKVRRLRSERPDLVIEVDGGIDPDTLPQVKEAGADTFVVGSFLARAPDLGAATRTLMELA